MTVFTFYPLRVVLYCPDSSGRLIEQYVAFRQHDIRYQPRSTIEAHIVANFFAEFTTLKDQYGKYSMPYWHLYLDGSTNLRGKGIGVILRMSTKELIEKLVRLQFSATNNVVEYEALITGMRLDLHLGTQKLIAHSDFQLMVNQLNGKFEARESNTVVDLSKAKDETAKIKFFSLLQAPRE